MHPFYVICINKMLSCAGTNRLQTGMHGAFGKPQGTVARINIGQIIFSVCSKDTNKAVIIEALHRYKYKFAGCQKIIVSKKWDFTKLSREEYAEARQSDKLCPNGCHVKYLSTHGSLEKYYADALKV
ncbi:60S ribosomal protein L10-A [Jimgerdemannia flammicorona]|uniref:60S ribosomal protein L10-A n=1 Tax=Jimgerdemannia flammicorona TaxID=994334 RepID=A0A433DCU7_9FUNG|nr:60S ribosomal protein L10-A [Jimgerdemannia flammicorona]